MQQRTSFMQEYLCASASSSTPLNPREGILTFASFQDRKPSELFGYGQVLRRNFKLWLTVPTTSLNFRLERAACALCFMCDHWVMRFPANEMIRNANIVCAGRQDKYLACFLRFVNILLIITLSLRSTAVLSVNTRLHPSICICRRCCTDGPHLTIRRAIISGSSIKTHFCIRKLIALKTKFCNTKVQFLAHFINKVRIINFIRWR